MLQTLLFAFIGMSQRPKNWKGEKSSNDDCLMIARKQMRAEMTTAVVDGVGLTILNGRWQAD